jgi:hypothetical protein
LSLSTPSAITVLIGTGGGIRRLIERYQRERNAPLLPCRAVRADGAGGGRVARRAFRSFGIVVTVFFTLGGISGGGRRRLRRRRAAGRPRASFVKGEGLTAAAALLACRLGGVAVIGGAVWFVIIQWRDLAQLWRDMGDE